MPQQVLNTVENNFTKGLLTEYTGLNFPENAATAASNCVFTLIGDVTRRQGFDFEANAMLNDIVRGGSAVSTYKWNNASGDGLTQFVVQQVGGTVYFYKSSAATVASPLSTQLLASTVSLSNLVPVGGTLDVTAECQFSDGNGYLFIYHPSCDPAYCVLNGNTITANVITIQIRDFNGVLEQPGLGNTVRPTVLSSTHNYNLQNQGWTSGNSWSVNYPFALTPATGVLNIIISPGLPIALGDQMTMSATDYLFDSPGGNSLITPQVATMTGTVVSYTSGTGAISLNITTSSITPNSWAFPNYGGDGVTYYSTGIYFGLNYPWQINSVNRGVLNTWFAAEGNFPSNADVWWYFKNTSGIFDPASTQPSVTLSSSNAPQGHFILNAFNQDRNIVAAGLGKSINTITTLVRPTTGTWFQGRVFYTGVNANFSAKGNVPNYSWTENIYFSQTITTPSQFGYCYQDNDPTSEQLFDILPTDGGVIQIQGCGAIYKLFPLMNSMLVFAANGVWYIAGGTSVGFSATDYTIVKLSAVRSISNTSFVDINGLPMFWNEEGIYQVEPAKQGQSLLNNPLHVNPLEVNPITVGTIQTFFNNIPLQSKKYVRGVYDPINYIVQWIYKSTNETSIFDRYTYNSILNFNNHNKAFYPYSFDIVTNMPPTINGIIYVQSPGGTGAPESTIKYVVSSFGSVVGLTFAEERDPNFVDWISAGVNNSNSFISTFTTGYKLHGKALTRTQIPYVYVYSRTGGLPTSYYIQSQWDYPISTDSGRISSLQYATINSPFFGMSFRRHRLRGWGIALQLVFSSVPGQPFDLMGWALYETANQGV